MATVLQLVDANKLFKLDPALEANEQEWRTIYALARCQSRIETGLPTWNSTWKIEVTPNQQLDALLEVFCSGETLTFGPQFKPLTHIKGRHLGAKDPRSSILRLVPRQRLFYWRGGGLGVQREEP
jgi:hypothetical protein